MWFKNIKNDNHNIKQELIMLKIDKSLDHQQIDDEQDEHKDGDESSQQALLSEKCIVDHSQLSLVPKLFEYGFIRLIKLASPDQASQLPQIIQTAITKFESPYVSIKCWSTLSEWERDNWMNVQPSKHLILINGYTHQGQWYEGDSYLSFSNPYALAECLRHYFSNQILDVIQNLWNDYHFMGSTKRIYVFGLRPYVDAISHIRIVDYCNPSSFLTSGKTPEFEPLLYCGFYNQHTTYQDHACNDDPPWDLDDSYPSDAYD